jgi:hypothetical protein
LSVACYALIPTERACLDSSFELLLVNRQFAAILELDLQTS